MSVLGLARASEAACMAVRSGSEEAGVGTGSGVGCADNLRFLVSLGCSMCWDLICLLKVASALLSLNFSGMLKMTHPNGG